MKHYCYIFQANIFVKIGYTNNIESRLETVQTSCPYNVVVICVFPYQTEIAAREMEISLHRRFAKFRVRGEWFRAKETIKHLRNNGKLIASPHDERR